jgi:hypothetical protein
MLSTLDMRDSRPWQARVVPARAEPALLQSFPSLHPSSVSKRPSHVPIFLSILCARLTCSCRQPSSLWVARSLARPVTAIHASPFMIPLCHFLVLTGFQIPSCLFSAIKQRAHRSFWYLFASWEKRHCSCSATDPISSISVPQPPQSVLALKIAQTWSSCEVACRILLACQHSSSFACLTK